MHPGRPGAGGFFSLREPAEADRWTEARREQTLKSNQNSFQKSIPNRHQDPSTNPKKNIKNHRQNGPKSRSGGGLGGSWSQSGRLGRVLGRIGCVLWRLGCILERLGGFFGASWGVFGRISVGKVANMAPTWLPKWSQDGQKFDPKLDHFFDASWGRFLNEF